MLLAKSAEFCELTLPTFSHRTKQVPVPFIRDLDQYFNLRQTPDELRIFGYSEQFKNLSQSSGFPVPLIN